MTLQLELKLGLGLVPVLVYGITTTNRLSYIVNIEHKKNVVYFSGRPQIMCLDQTENVF